MVKVLFTGDESQEQAVGSVLKNSAMQMYLVNQNAPRDYIFLGGHRIDDAPTYELTEGVPSPEYKFINGQNTVVESQLTLDAVKSVEFTVLLPNKMISVTDRLFANQKNFDYDFLLIPNECGSGCEQYFWLGEDATIGVRQITSAPVGFDESLAPITSTRTVQVTGQLRMYAGKQVTALTTQGSANAIHAIVVLDELNSGCAAGVSCPYQTIYRAGAGTFVEKSVDGGSTWTAITTTAIASDVTDAIITSLDYNNGVLIAGYSDVADGTGTDGGVAISYDDGAFALATMGTASTGVQKVVRAFGKVYAFGTAGQIFYSCDNGQTFTLLTQSVVTDDIFDAVYDSKRGLILMVGDAGLMASYDGSSLVDESANINAGANDLLSIALAGNSIYVGDGAGNLRASDDFVAGTSTWAIVTNVTNAVGGIAADARGYEVFFGEDGELHVINGNTYGNPTSKSTALAGAVTSAFAVAPNSDEYSSDVFHFGMDDGTHVVVSVCNLCVSGGC